MIVATIIALAGVTMGRDLKQSGGSFAPAKPIPLNGFVNARGTISTNFATGTAGGEVTGQNAQISGSSSSSSTGAATSGAFGNTSGGVSVSSADVKGSFSD